jgi:adenosylhomocysteine nucleosidase
MKVGIIGAMEMEVKLLHDAMKISQEHVIAGNIFYQGTLEGVEIILLQSGIGKVHAAVATTLLIERFHPNYVINIGTAGGLDKLLAIGDVVISLEVRHHDVDLTIWGYEHGQLPKLPVAFLPNQFLVEAAQRAAQKMSLGVTKGLIVSGDIFIHRDEDLAKIKRNFPDAHAVEMEGAAIAQVCHQFHTPFVLIRAVSDLAGANSHIISDAFLEESSRNSAQLLLHTLAELGLAR